ncbi:MAG: hypothetical protein WCF47_02195 [Pseudolabrys sp.]
MRAGAKAGCGGMILAYDFSGLAPNELRGGTANDLRGYYLGGETDFCRLMTGATIDAEFRIESAGSLLVILSALPKLESSVGTVASPERTCVNPITLAEAAFP